MNGKYHVFKRRCWVLVNGTWVPHHNGRKVSKAHGLSLGEAREMCAEHNPPPGERGPGNPTHYYEFEAE